MSETEHTQGNGKRKLGTSRLNARSPVARRLMELADEWREQHGPIVASSGELRRFVDHINQQPGFERYVSSTPETWCTRLADAEAARAMDARHDAREQMRWSGVIHALLTEFGGGFKRITDRSSMNMNRLTRLSRCLVPMTPEDMREIGRAFNLTPEDIARRFGVAVPVQVTKPATAEQVQLPLAAARAPSGGAAEACAIICEVAERKGSLTPVEVLLLADMIDPARFGVRALIEQRRKAERKEDKQP